jgi:hypothetical protein
MDPTFADNDWLGHNMTQDVKKVHTGWASCAIYVDVARKNGGVSENDKADVDELGRCLG